MNIWKGSRGDDLGCVATCSKELATGFPQVLSLWHMKGGHDYKGKNCYSDSIPNFAYLAGLHKLSVFFCHIHFQARICWKWKW